VRLVAADKQDFTGNVGRGGSGERGCGITDVDAVHAPVCWQRTLEEECVDAERHRTRFDAHHPGQAQDHPLKAGGPHLIFDLGFVRAVEIRRLHRGVRAQQLVVPVWVAGTDALSTAFAELRSAAGVNEFKRQERYPAPNRTGPARRRTDRLTLRWHARDAASARRHGRWLS
jgi:hypothetical protein